MLKVAKDYEIINQIHEIKIFTCQVSKLSNFLNGKCPESKILTNQFYENEIIINKVKIVRC